MRITVVVVAALLVTSPAVAQKSVLGEAARSPHILILASAGEAGYCTVSNNLVEAEAERVLWRDGVLAKPVPRNFDIDDLFEGPVLGVSVLSLELERRGCATVVVVTLGLARRWISLPMAAVVDSLVEQEDLDADRIRTALGLFLEYLPAGEIRAIESPDMILLTSPADTHVAQVLSAVREKVGTLGAAIVDRREELQREWEQVERNRGNR